MRMLFVEDNVSLTSSIEILITYSILKISSKNAFISRFFDIKKRGGVIS